MRTWLTYYHTNIFVFVNTATKGLDASFYLDILCIYLSGSMQMKTRLTRARCDRGQVDCSVRNFSLRLTSDGSVTFLQCMMYTIQQGDLKCRTRKTQDLENDGTNRRAGKYKTKSFCMQLCQCQMAQKMYLWTKCNFSTNNRDFFEF